MKKHIIFIVSLMLAGLVGCSEDPNVEVYESAGSQHLIVTLPTTATRIEITDGESSVSLNWEESDKFSVYTTDGDYVTDFVYSSLSSNDDTTTFVVDGSGAKLVDKVSYIAVFPSADGSMSLTEHRAAIEAKATSQAQEGNNSKEHFNDHLLMEAEFTYSSSNNTAITFEHKMAAIRLIFAVADGYTPTKVIFDDGDFESYTLTLSNTISTEQYTANYVILPNEEGATRELRATIYASSSDALATVNNFSIESSAVYSAGVQYRSELSIDEITTAIEIATVADLVAFREAVNSGSTTLNANLLKDIDLEGGDDNQWTPIGTSDCRYSGTFDGGGNSISGLYINSDSTLGVALFGICDGATISDLTIEGELTNTGMESTAAFVGCAYNTTLRSCSTTASTTINGMMNNTGGIAGYISVSTIDNCVNNARIIGSRYVGGLVGYTSDSVSSYISNSTNNGEVSDDNATSDKNSYVGGLAGMFQGLYGSITNSGNTGSVTNSYEYTGGVSGTNRYTTIDNCYNTAEVKGAKYCGGITGHLYSSSAYDTGIINSFNSGSVYINITTNSYYVGGLAGLSYASRVANSYNIGSVGNSYSRVTGGLVGWSWTSASVTACYNAGAVTSGYNPASLISTNGSTCTATYCYNDMDVSSADMIVTDEDSSDTMVENCSTEYMQMALFVEVMNNAAYRYNLDSPSVKAYGWALNSGGYPVLDSSVTPTAQVTAPIEISSAEELAKIGVDNAYSRYDSYILTQSIDLADAEWTPIGSESDFGGTFDGDGYSITGLAITASESAQGLFSTCYGATIKNLKVGGVVTNDNSHTAIIAGASWYTTFENCETLEGSVVTATSGDSSAGIAGYAYGCSFSSCINHADVSGVVLAGGIVGYTNDNSDCTTIENCVNYGVIQASTKTAGGMVGTTNSSATLVISNCDNYGSVTVVDGDYAAGIAAAIYRGSIISNCNNYAAISAVSYTGGIVGICNNDGYAKSISNCYNEGDITGSDDFAGGIAAKLYGASGAVSTMTNCANIGTISCIDNYLGGLAGANQGGAIYNSYNLGEVTGTSSCAGGLVGIHENNSGYNAIMENSYTCAEVTTTSSSSVGLVVGKCDGATITSCYYDSAQGESLSAIGLNNDSQSVTAYSSLSTLLSELNSGASTITDAAVWVAGSDSYPTFSFIE